MELTNEEDIQLWECLHDGTLESLAHDALARTITLIVDVPYIWNFHKLPDETRFHILLREVSIVEALSFQSWPGELPVPNGLPWKEQQTIRRENYNKGYMESTDWNSQSARITSCKDYEFSNAFISMASGGQPLFVAQLSNTEINDYPTLRITAREIGFFLNSNQEMDLSKFLSLGNAYWEAFAARSVKAQSKN